MKPATRRAFVKQTARLSAGGGLAAVLGSAQTAADQTAAVSEDVVFQMRPIGRVEQSGERARLRIFTPYVAALKGLAEWSHVNVFYWFDRNDNPRKRAILRVHPRGNPRNPEVGVFACRAPVRPNLIALTVCKIVSVKGAVVTVDRIDAWENTPLLDLKPFIPPDAPREAIRVPAWARRK
jgi:tRNA-Thr(GGU) m(6)t(6)A37 methyltransferase TsaA